MQRPCGNVLSTNSQEAYVAEDRGLGEKQLWLRMKRLAGAKPCGNPEVIIPNSLSLEQCRPSSLTHFADNCGVSKFPWIALLNTGPNTQSLPRERGRSFPSPVPLPKKEERRGQRELISHQYELCQHPKKAEQPAGG